METIDLPSSHVRLNQTSARIQRIKLLLKRRWWIPAIFICIGAIYQGFQATSAPKQYESVGTLALTGKIQLKTGVNYAEQRSFLEDQENYIKSGQVRERAATRVETLRPELVRSKVRISVYRIKGTSVSNVVATGTDPEYTKALLEATLDEYIKYRSELRVIASDNTVDAITGQILRLEKQKELAEKEVADFIDLNNIVVLEQGSNSAAQYLADLRRKLAKLETEVELLRQLDVDQNIDRHASDAALPADSENLNSEERQMFALTGSESSYLSAKQTLDLLRARKLKSAETLRPQHPAMIEFDDQIAEQLTLVEIYKRQSIDKYKQREAAMELQMASLKNEIIDWEQRALATTVKLNEHGRLKSRLANTTTIHTRLLGNLRELDISRNLEQENVHVMEKPSIALEKPPETTKKVAMGAIFGLLAGAGLLFLIDRLDDRINGFAEFQANFSEDVLAQIPQQAEQGLLTLLQKSDDRHLYAEAFRNLRSSILFKHWHPSPPKTILITSAVPAEGKTTTAANLAVTMAHSGARVLLVDGDVRRGSLHDIFSRSTQRGLSDILTTQVSWREAVQRTENENLFLIARGSATD
ncbi:MAG: AAA family ATPase, partial [Verrucomicrobiales bacterium]|nr:AAA family ATPase [Verrucomicrobiales bacterium]